VPRPPLAHHCGHSLLLVPCTSASHAAAATPTCTNMFERAGSMPAAMYVAAMVRVEVLRSTGSWGAVMACRSTTQKKVSAQGGARGGRVWASKRHAGRGSGALPARMEQARASTPASASCVHAPTVRVLQAHPVLDGAQVVAEVQLAGGLHAAQDAFAPCCRCWGCCGLALHAHVVCGRNTGARVPPMRAHACR